MGDEQLKGHRKKLEAAINQALAESIHINSVIQDTREVGYDVFLIIEATIGFTLREETPSISKQTTRVRLKLPTQDEKFLKSLKIRPE